MASRESSRESSPASGRQSPFPTSAQRSASPLVSGVAGKREEKEKAVMAKDISTFVPPELQGVTVKELIAAIGELVFCLVFMHG